jgi:hypothetical protein
MAGEPVAAIEGPRAPDRGAHLGYPPLLTAER